MDTSSELTVLQVLQENWQKILFQGVAIFSVIGITFLNGGKKNF